ncbi:molybdopterin-guanine dinucleotide biosynthesis adapter protein [mine drainage metagenome]|uniref:Molybdopterin-guanine dinucleotide biosynthesis adapter protein n=1 Tax=mine drainage metagenome TaxID=410659 RepID=A0A1J5Q908_9ZZZZ
MSGSIGPGRIPLLGICASGSGIGKTTLLTALIPALAAQGFRVSVVKHAHHAFDIDHPGKDSYRIRESGAVQTLIGSRLRWALMTELSRLAPDQPEPDLEQLLMQMDTSLVDMILVEGFKQAPIPKIEVYRPSLGKPLLAEHDANIIAIAADGIVQTSLPVLDLNDPAAIARFVISWSQSHESIPIIDSSRTP